MTEQLSGASPEISVGEPQPLEFQLIAADDRAAVYEALVVDCKTSGSPVLGVTVTVASSVRRDAGPELDKLLRGMKAAFVLLPEPPPDDGGSDDDEPFDIDTQIQIEFRLASYGGKEPVGVAMTVVTTTGSVPAPIESDSGDGTTIEKKLPHTVGAKLDDYWHTNSNDSFTAHVTPSIGDGTIRKHGKAPIPVTAHHTAHHTACLTAKQVIVHASNNGAMTYSLTGSGSLVRHNVP